VIHILLPPGGSGPAFATSTEKRHGTAPAFFFVLNLPVAVTYTLEFCIFLL